MVSRFPETVHRLETSKLACITPEPAPVLATSGLPRYVCSPDCALSTSLHGSLDGSLRGVLVLVLVLGQRGEGGGEEHGRRAHEGRRNHGAPGGGLDGRLDRNANALRRVGRGGATGGGRARAGSNAARHGGAGALPARVGAD